MHRLKVKQAVVPAQSGRERPDTYEIVRLLPELPNGEPQYRIRGRESGVERVVREAEIRPLFR
ncbi:MAG TPA: hypothetical protein VHL98_09500 [Microvirga sp.]|jgi:hypothetical protein|nr:hypothetical protein [Microvirga sp.]